METAKPRFTNRLIHETSPYLLQHAHNPVQWWPWCEDAFEKATKEDKPIFLSIGYSTCHWCHVMERESFEDEEIASYLNEHFVPIKVDREERPDVDAVYMAAVQLLNGHGGWPMSVFLTPEKRPFFGGTYFPARDGDRGSSIGFRTLLQRIVEVYNEDRYRVVERAKEISNAVRSSTQAGAASGELREQILHDAYESFREQFDSVHGGFGFAPKFPRPAIFSFLFQYARRSGRKDAADMALATLAKMSEGGLRDQIGGGFHRYSTDRAWLVPHFEKMLYDNAQLVLSYLDAYQWTHDDTFAAIANDTLEYVLREMTHEKGGFFSGTDADSEGEEGTFFVWSNEEWMSLLGQDNGKKWATYFGVTPNGNFEGKNILHVADPSASKPDKLELGAIREKMRLHREKRPHPQLDDKVLTAWNGLMIAAFARAGAILNEPKFIEAAKKCAVFISNHLVNDKKRLLRSWREGKAQLNAYADDYAFLTFGLLALFEVTQEQKWLDEAKRYQAELDHFFWDRDADGYFMTSFDHEELLLREKPFYDGAEPAANSVAALNLQRLFGLTGDEPYAERALKVIRSCGSILEKGPSVSPLLACALDYALDRSKEIFIVLPNGGAALEPFLSVYFHTYLPNASLRVGLEGTLKEKTCISGKVTAYVCERGSCKLPTTDLQVFADQLRTIYSL